MQLLPVLTVAPVAAANHNNNNSFGNTGPTHRVLSSAGEPPQVTVQPVVNGGSTMRTINISSQSASHNINDITVYPWHSLVPFLTTTTSLVGGAKEPLDEEKSPPPPSGNKNDSFGGSKRTGIKFTHL